MTRLQAIRAYLEGWLDYFPFPEVTTGSMQRRSVEHGPAPFRTVQCSDCDGQGRRQGGWPCVTCQGRGKYAIDAYTGEAVTTVEASWSELLDTASSCSSCGGHGRLGAHAETRPDQEHDMCDRCHGSGVESALFGGKIRADIERVSVPRQGDSLLDALQDGLTRREALESGRKIHDAMRQLREVDELGHALLCWTLVLHGERPETLMPSMRVRWVQALMRLDSLVVGPVRLPMELVQAERARAVVLARSKGRHASVSARAARDREIVRLWQSGSWSQDALGRKFGVSQSVVSRVVNDGREEAA